MGGISEGYMGSRKVLLLVLLSVAACSAKNSGRYQISPYCDLVPASGMVSEVGEGGGTMAFFDESSGLTVIVRPAVQVGTLKPESDGVFSSEELAFEARHDLVFSEYEVTRVLDGASMIRVVVYGESRAITMSGRDRSVVSIGRSMIVCGDKGGR